MADHVSVFSRLSDVYHDIDGSSQKRFDTLKEKFTEIFGASPSLYARSPGRVNLIGEHIDYEGYSVFPMAILQDTVVAIKREGTDIVVANINQSKYPTHTFSPDPDQSVDVASGSWTNYFLAAYKGVYEFLKEKDIPHPDPSGLKVLVDGRVPTGSGLSSSSALVCASALAILAVDGLIDKVSKADIAEFTCSCERHSGTESGGMDQAISIMAKEGFAKLIDFNPVRGTDLSLPSSGVFVVGNSLAVSNKAETANQRYNLRVVECRIAVMVLAKALGLPKEQFSKLRILREIQDLPNLKDMARTLLEETEYDSSMSICLSLVQKCLKKDVYSLQEVEDLLQISLKEAFRDSPNGVRVLDHLVVSKTGLALQKRAQHCFSEVSRVSLVKSLCEDTEKADSDKLAELGAIMNEGHASSRDLYDCSCPELEELISVFNSFGSMGSRLTGAGWGGCAIALIKDSQQRDFINNIKSAFYSKRVEDGLITEEELDKCVFASKPSAGAAILKI